MASRKRSAAITKALKTLEGRYGKKPKPPNWNLIDTLIFYILYYDSGVTAARRAFKLLRDDYVDLNEVRVSSLNEIRSSLKKASASETSAMQLRSALKQIFLCENDVSLEQVAELTPEQAKRYFSKLDNIPAHTVDYMLLVKWNHPILPIDKQIALICSRVGFVTRNSSITTVQKSLMRDLKKDLFFDFFSLFLEHASKVCCKEPHCDRCILKKQCKYGNTSKRKKK